MRDMETCVKHQVPIIITSLQVSAELVAAAHSYGGVVFHDVISIRHAEKAIEAGVDGLILVCAGAGGHAGTLSPSPCCPRSAASSRAPSPWRAPSPTASPSWRPRPWVPTSPTWAPASSPRRRPTRWTPTSRCWWTPAPRTSSIPPVHRRAGQLPQAQHRRRRHGPGQPAQRRQEQDGFRLGRQQRAAKAWRDIWGAGQGVGSIDSVPSVAELVDQLKAEYREAREDIARRAARFGA
jgi:nitronate monooxygenase